MARGNLEEANTHQKKSRTKYILFTLLIIIIAGLIVAFTVMM